MEAIKQLRPWAKRAFELIFHAEIHNLRGQDYDRRLALISFDNSIEVSITTYLSLHPSQRDEKKYDKKDVEKWLNNFPSKLDFFEYELTKLGLPINKSKGEIIFYHEQRNELYHGKSANVPEEETIKETRQIALWVFSVLFNISDVEEILNNAVLESDSNVPAIPDEYVKPKQPELSLPSVDQVKALAISSLVGQWDEGNESDKEIIRRLIGEI